MHAESMTYNKDVSFADDTSESPLQLRSLSKTFQGRRQDQVLAVDNVNIDVRNGEFLVLLGPSGCGKTTLLRCVAGLEQPDTGDISVCGRTVFAATGEKRFNMPTASRGLSMMFQSYALWPHMTVRENVFYPLQVRGVSRRNGRSQVDDILTLLDIMNLADRYPSQISGGQQQRVALGRALIAESRLILFDEPLSNVDAKTRDQLRRDLSRMQREIGFAGLYVTHDQKEAFGLGHKIAVMRSGRVEQIGTPKEIYSNPCNAYVARFVGVTNEIIGSVKECHRGEIVLSTALGDLAGRSDADFNPGDKALAIFRPENCAVRKLARETGSDRSAVNMNTWVGRLEATAFEGATMMHSIRVNDFTIDAMLISSSDSRVDDYDDVQVYVDPADVLIAREED
jgi:iron(III) transport system ATP-binding protein